MLGTFVIGLREGLEASLIVGIIAAFLARSGRRDLLRSMAIGVTAAILLCAAVAVTLEVISADLPRRQQEGLETVIGLVAVVMVTYMIVWMRRHSRALRHDLEGAAAAALRSGSGSALVVMAFLAVLREGLETSVFLLAAFNASTSGADAAIGAALGVLVAVGLGWGIYRGGVRLNLARFFRITGVVLVFVAAGLLATAAHTAHEAGWLDVGQQSTVDLSAVVRPGSVQASLFTSVLGVQPRPVAIELIAWLAYVIPVGLYVVWPAGRALPRRRTGYALLGGAAAGGVTAIALFVAQPGTPAAPTVHDGIRAELVSSSGDSAQLRTDVTQPGNVVDVSAQRADQPTLGGVRTDRYVATTTTDGFIGGPARLTEAELVAANGGRLPLGVRSPTGDVPVRYQVRTETSFWVEPSSERIVDVQSRQSTTTLAQLSVGTVAIGTPTEVDRGWSPGTVAAQTRAAQSAADALRDAGRLRVAGWLLALAATVVAGLGLVIVWRRRPRTAVGRPAPGVPAPTSTAVS